MEFEISESRISGVVDAPPSKSYSHRAVIIGSCAHRPVKVKNLLLAGDIEATLGGCRALGAETHLGMDSGNHVVELFLPEFTRSPAAINAQKSGTTIRLLLGVASTIPTRIELTGNASLVKRPLGPLVEILRQLGASIEELGVPGYPPVASLGGRGAGSVYLPALLSSQFISSLLVSSPLVEGTTFLTMERPKSVPYLFITHEVMHVFGFALKYSTPRPGILAYEIPGPQSPPSTPITYEVPGDWSGAAMILAAGALAGSVTVKGLHRDQQGDQAILEILRAMGAEVVQHATGDGGLEVTVESGAPLEGIQWDCADTPDLVPVIATLGAVAKGETRITGAEHLRIKESNRLETLAAEYRKVGVDIVPTADGLRIRGGTTPHGVVDSHSDHRLAMSLGVLGLCSPKGIRVIGTTCVRDSYPTFTQHLKALGANIHEYDR